MEMAQILKKNTENQSIAAAVLRCSVGKENAASTARAGKPSINARSEPPMATDAIRHTSTAPSGMEMCRFNRCCRQRHKVHRARGRAGQVNHPIWRITPQSWIGAL